MATYVVADGTAVGFPAYPAGTAVIRKIIDIPTQIAAGQTAAIGDVFTSVYIPAGALVEAVVVYVQRVDAAGAAAFSVADSGGAANLLAASSVAALVPFSYVTQKFYATADRVDITCVKALTTAKLEVVVLLSNTAA